MINQIIRYARENGCSDIHLTQELPPVLRKNGNIMVTKDIFPEFHCEEVIKSMLNEKQKALLLEVDDIDFCYTLSTGERQRVNVYHQQGVLCSAIRLLNDKIPTFEDLNLPNSLRQLASLPNGLILVTGPTGSGKSTTLAAMIDYINRMRRSHIITMEDPIEYIHHHKNSIVHQREIGTDAPSFQAALRSSLREDPDVILVGEMRDLETISAAVTAAETGHLVLSTLHTTGAANTIDRMIDVFPDGAKGQIRTQLSTVLRGVVTQQLVPLLDGSGRCAAFEILLNNDAVANLIRENKCYQIPSILQTNVREGMCSLNYDLASLVKQGKISMEDALDKATNQVELKRFIS